MHLVEPVRDVDDRGCPGRAGAAGRRTAARPPAARARPSARRGSGRAPRRRARGRSRRSGARRRAASRRARSGSRSTPIWSSTAAARSRTARQRTRPAVRGQPPERDVLGDGQRRGVLELLVDHADAGGARRRSASGASSVSPPISISADVRRVVAGEDPARASTCRRRSRRAGRGSSRRRRRGPLRGGPRRRRTTSGRPVRSGDVTRASTTLEASALLAGVRVDALDVCGVMTRWLRRR